MKTPSARALSAIPSAVPAALLVALSAWLTAGVLAQDFVAPTAPPRPAPMPAAPERRVDGVLVAAFRGGARPAATAEGSGRYVEQDQSDPFQRPARPRRPIAVRLLTFEFW